MLIYFTVVVVLEQLRHTAYRCTSLCMFMVAATRLHVSFTPLCRRLLQTEKMDAKCVTWQEANMKMELANMIFDDLIEDTASAFCDAHHMPVPAEV